MSMKANEIVKRIPEETIKPAMAAGHQGAERISADERMRRSDEKAD